MGIGKWKYAAHPKKSGAARNIICNMWLSIISALNSSFLNRTACSDGLTPNAFSVACKDTVECDMEHIPHILEAI
jgi:hypothetical protein